MARTSTSTKYVGEDWPEDLPAPVRVLRDLGLTDKMIEQARAARPTVVADQAMKAEGAYFDVERVKKLLRVLSKFSHTKGRWAGQPLVIGQGLAPWQIVWALLPLGYVRYDPETDQVVRVVREIYIEVPRKAGKSTLSSAVANYLLLADGEAGGEVYAAAGDREQARRVFDDAKRMCLTSDAAKGRVQALSSLIRVPKTDNIFRVLSKVAEAAHGLNVSGAVIDELHVHKKRDLVDAIRTGTGARTQPLVIFITTADEADEGTIYDELHSYTRNVADGTVQDPSHYGVIWAADPTDDPFDEATWRKANPGLGVSPSLSYLRKEAERARTTPSYFPTFCRLHLNMRMRSQSRLIDMRAWNDVSVPVSLDDIAGRPAYGGFDLSAVSDFTSWWIGVESAKPGVEMECRWRFYVPEDAVDELERRLLVPVRQWVNDGWVTATEGNVIDYDRVRSDALADCAKVRMKRISFDRMFAGPLIQEMQAKLPKVEFSPVVQNYSGNSAAIKDLQRMLGTDSADRKIGSIRVDDNPVAKWMASVVEVKTDPNDNLKLVKPDRIKSQSRIDGISAMVTGLDGYVRRPKKKLSRVWTR